MTCHHLPDTLLIRVVILLLTLTVIGLTARASFAPAVVKVAELSLRKAAIQTAMPEFPAESVKRGASGVAVVQILFDAQGVVTRTKILEAPDELTSQAVLVAARQWRIKPQTVNGDSVYIKSKLTFYFVIDRPGVGHVRNPKQVS
jgi:TonB family protein